MEHTLKSLKRARIRAVVLFVASILMFLISTGATIAFIVAETPSVDNVFTPPILRINLQGSNDISNVGDLPVYVRALAVVNWVSTTEEHTILSEQPKEGVDFEIDFHTTDWFLASDGFYYYRKPLAAGEQIHIIETAYRLVEKPGYEIRIEILSSAIQINTPAAIEEAWPAVCIDQNGWLDNRLMQNEEESR